ncbi:MAG: 50S ribosomal protein L29 [Bacteroidota bacterium]
MKAHELRELSDAELQKRIQEEEESLANLRFQKVLSQLENPMKLRLTRKDIAKMKTILRERQLKKPQEKSVPSDKQEKA